jgi:hypothetical protein
VFVEAAFPRVIRLRKVGFGPGYVFNAGLVDYFDPETFDGRFARDKIPFTKAQKFSYQKEYRITVDTKTNGNDPITIEIGDICDCAAKMRIAEVNRSFKLEPRAERL